MKTTLFATTALAAGLIAAPLFAAEAPTAEVRGYINAGMYYGDLAGTAGEFGVEHDGEIHFRWSGSSDNGLTFKGEVEMEAFSTTDQIDEYWTSVSGSFGDFRIGADDTAAEYMELGIIYSPAVKIAYFDGFGYSGGDNWTASNRDDLGVYYITPEISGFTAAISFQPEDSDNGRHGTNPVFQQNNAGSFVSATNPAGNNIDNVLSIGAQWMGEFNGVSLGISGGFETSDKDTLAPVATNGLDTETWTTGGYIGYAGFTFAAFYEDRPEFQTGGVGGENVALGLSYETGPWTVAGGWATRFDTTNTGAGVADLNDYDVWAGWVTYAIAPGVRGTVGFEYLDGNNPANDGNFIAGGYLNVSF